MNFEKPLGKKGVSPSDSSARIKAVAFDLDNTLIDFMSFKKKTALAAARAMRKAGLMRPSFTIAKDIFLIYDEYGIEYQKTFSRLLWNKYRIRNKNTFEKIQQAGIIAYLKEKFRVLKTYPAVISTLKRIRKEKYHLYIVTDAPRNKAWQRLVLTGLEDLFDIVITHDDTGKHKPHDLPFKTLLEECRLKPEQILFVGDNPEKDIKGAKKQGMKTALAQYGWILNKKSRVKADYNLRTIHDLLNVLGI